MTLQEKIFKKIGSDKILHFLGGMAITALFSPLGIVGLLCGLVFTVAVSVFKEILDKKFEWKDILAGTLGGLLALVIDGGLILILN